jgi:hypothetical protein
MIVVAPIYDIDSLAQQCNIQLSQIMACGGLYGPFFEITLTFDERWKSTMVPDTWNGSYTVVKVKTT